MCSPNRSRSTTDLLTGDLANILLAYNHSLYQASPFLELVQNDLGPSRPMTSTPDRVPRAIRSLWPSMSLSFENHPSYVSTPRCLLPPSTPSKSLANMQMVSSPSPLSQVPSLCYPEISPPSQGSGSTPFERQFTSDFSQDWGSLDSEFSPVVRRSSCDEPHQPSSTSSKAYDASGSQDPQDVIQGVSLIDRFISAAADESGTTGDASPYSTSSSPARFSSPLSDLSDLTSSSLEREHPLRFGRRINLGLRICGPSTSSNPERPTKPKKRISSYDTDEELSQNSDRETSPTRSSTDDQDYRPAKGNPGRKRKRAPQTSGNGEPATRRKKARTGSPPQSTTTDSDASLEILARRRLPSDIPRHPQFSLFYLRFPVSSYLRTDDGRFPLLTRTKLPGGTYNEPRDAMDLYTPRFVKGCGFTKVGLCPICIESPSRGGKGESVWLSMKFSAYKCYHMQYSHGISSVSTRPFSPPSVFRSTQPQHPGKNDRTTVLEGKCHKCKKWILLESIKNLDIKVKELYWWKHAAACHKGTHMSGDDDFFVDDEIYHRVCAMDSGNQP